MNISIAKNTDIAELCLLLDVLFSQEDEFVPNHETQTKGLSSIIHGANTGEIIVARKSGEMIGMVNLLYTISTALGGRVALLEDMVVLPKARGLGVGSKLIEYAIKFAKENKCKRITLLTDCDNEGAHRFYQQHDFMRSAMVVFRNDLGDTNNA